MLSQARASLAPSHVAAGLLFALASSVPVSAAAGDTVWDGVYSTAQAARGKAAYMKACSTCHKPDLSGALLGASAGGGEPPPLMGNRFKQNFWEGTVRNVFNRIREEPKTSLTIITDDDRRDVVAYVLQVNGFPAGARELDAQTMGLIRIEAREGPAPVPDFSVVRAVGCLGQDAKRAWTLRLATDVQRLRDSEASTDAELKQAAATPPGTRSFVLLDIYPSPAALIGHKVEVKGVWLKTPSDRINVNSLQTTSAVCQD